MQELKERTSPPPMAEPRRVGLIALLAVGVVAVVGVVAWLLVGGDEEQSATDIAQDFAAAMRAGDLEAVPGLDPDLTSVDAVFIDWMMALEIEPTFTDCTEIVGVSNTRVNCTVNHGDEYFHAVIAGREMPHPVYGSVSAEGVFTLQNWPPPDGLVEIEAEFRDWVKEAHPELEDQMWTGLGLKGTQESGELRMQLLDEYLASRSAF